MRDRPGLLLRTLLAVGFISLGLVLLGAETGNGAPIQSADRDYGYDPALLCAGETGNGAPVIVAMNDIGRGSRSGGDIGPGAPLHGTGVGNG